MDMLWKNFQQLGVISCFPPKGEEDSIMLAFHECTLGLDKFDRSSLDDHALKQVEKLEEFMNTDGVDDPKKKKNG